MRSLLIAAAALAILTVQAGLLVTELSPANGTRVSVTWLQGVEQADVRYADGSIYRRNMTLISGPNRCFVYGADGNDRSIVVEPQSDDSGPARDATVDCRICGCEEEPGTRFTCTSNGACASCDPCDQDTCSTGEVCIRESCSEYSCACDPIQCEGRTCEQNRTVSGACVADACEKTSRCIEGSCGAECNDGSRTTTRVCIGDVLVAETETCSGSCQAQIERTRIRDCSLERCGPGLEPVCTQGGCACV